MPFALVEATKQIDRRIDDILVRRGAGVSVSGAFVISDEADGGHPSDHVPVIADVRLAAPPIAGQ